MCEFTVIIPVYKAEKFLKKCVDSVLNQTYQQDYQVILVDDGSPDRSGEICDFYATEDSRVTVIHKKNGGVARARETGLRLACGEYIVFVDSDDWVHEDMLYRLSQAISGHHPDMVFFGYYTAGKKGIVPKPNPNRLGYYDQKEIEQSIYPRLIQTQKGTYFSSSLWTESIRKDILLKCYPKDCDIKIGEDFITAIACTYYAKSIYILEDCLYYYRYNEESATKGGQVFNWDDPARQKEYLEQQIDVRKFDFAQQLDRMIVHNLFSTAISQFNAGKSYCIVSQDIRNQLKRPIYASAICNSKFSGSKKALLMDWCMKIQCVSLMAIWSKVKQLNMCKR